MFIKIAILASILFLTSLVSCREITIRPEGDCRPGTLHYVTDCGSVKAYVVLDEDGSIKTILQDIPREFRSSSVRVCISYREVASTTSGGCVQGAVIEIVSIGLL